MKHTFTEWITATRYWSFPVSAMPIIVTFMYLLGKGLVPQGGIPYLCMVLSLIAVVTIHSSRIDFGMPWYSLSYRSEYGYIS